jgi:hypothetical protein
MPLTNAGREALEALSPRTRPVTEEEASKILCPEKFEFCQGRKCMHWRFKNFGASGEHVVPVGYCGPAGDPS